MVVPTVDGCKDASKQLNITYKYTMDKADRPAGCYKDSELDAVYFNKIIDPDQTNPTEFINWLMKDGTNRFAGICKRAGKCSIF